MSKIPYTFCDLFPKKIIFADFFLKSLQQLTSLRQSRSSLETVESQTQQLTSRMYALLGIPPRIQPAAATSGTKFLGF